MKKFTISRVINAPLPIVWETVGDPRLYHRFAPTIGEVEMLTDSRRRCFDADLKNSWEEDVVTYIEGEKYSMKVDTSTMKDENGEPANYPLKSMQGTWEVEKVAENKTKIIMSFDYEMKYWIIGSIMHVILRVPRTFEKMCIPIMDNYEEEILSKIEVQ